MSPLLLGANLIIALCYFTIALLVGLHLWRVRAGGRNALGLATFGIFLTCGLGHSIHVLSYITSMLPAAPTAHAIGQFICSVIGGSGAQNAVIAIHAHQQALLDTFSVGFGQVQLVVDMLTIIPAAAFLALRRRYRLLAEGEAVILDYQQTIQIQDAIVAERTAALATAEAHARDLAEAHARTEQARSAAEQAALALRASERRFRLLAENARDIIYRYQLGEHPTFEYVSPAVTGVLGYPPEDWYADPQLLATIMHPDDLRLWELMTHEPDRLAHPQVFRCVRGNGTSVWIEQQTTVVEDGDRNVRVLECVARDITERVQAEETRRGLERNLQEAQRLESIGILAGGIAHDFNNLLTAILGNAELALLDLPEQAETRESIETIRLSAQRAADLTSQMLAYAGKGKYIVLPVNLNSVIHEMNELLGMSVFKRCSLAFRLESSLPAVDADVAQMRQVIMNLLLNAAEAISEPDGMITVSTGLVALAREQLDKTADGASLPAGSYVQLEVQDTGCGMDAATIERIFDPFFTTKFTGRGLGLSAVQGILRSHHGALRVHSAPNQGTTFQIWLPVSSAQPQDEGTHAQPTTTAHEGALMLIDDEASVRAATQLMLEQCGFTVYAASHGAEGLETLGQVGALRGVLLDLTMPGMSGAEVAHAIRSRWTDLPILLMSGYSASDLAEQYADLGITGFLQKPFTLGALQTALLDALSQAPVEG